MKVYSDPVMNVKLETWWEERTWGKYEQYGFLVKYWLGMNMHHELGNIKKTNDGRWRWTALNSKDKRFAMPEKTDKVQGTVSTKEEAQAKLEAIWSIHDIKAS